MTSAAPTLARSSSFTPATSAACTASAMQKTSNASASLETILEPFRRERRARAARRMALHVHRDRIHRDVGRRGLDVHGERRRIAAQALRPDAQQIYGLAELALELCAFRVLAYRA